MEKKYIAVFSTALIIILIDQATKFLARANLQLGQAIPVISNVFHLTYIQNTGAGFGILKAQTALLIFVSVGVIGIIFYNFDKIKNEEALLQVLAGFVLGGTIGNLIDRLAYGRITDFLDFRIWPIFNFADSFVTAGIIGLVIHLWKK